ncbi:metallo-beta-lactamase superfamily protein [Wuchereria bancrofti]|uniref:Metallo-beta-lactamase superfamily protein n=1 Tax=Wuchereria bancrofti TaxID=6293 RepID=J9DRT4_WUCBA|nr:metallo-beta-lactamase superfamily protein [Wuchereria bancrofti]
MATDHFDPLPKYSLNYDDITDLIITHGHSDHWSNLSLFQQAKIYMGDDMAKDGDIFEENDDSWKENSKYPEEQEKSRKIILNEADWIIPGHGRMFKNKLNM